ncbi:hypothetical protein V494_05523 [Pseudogymnoascus sp. VKM F-4513 (FW-928)]|nr:hypothetical protein V494_05523 [Pseudogymnoascus sp. VKM F-4513 (FW-928)]
MGRPNGGTLMIFVDCVSPYSWFGFTSTIRYRPLLQAHGVSIDIVPFFLGGARERVGNPYTPTPKWKEAFSAQDSDMTGRLLGLKVVPPKEFPISSLYPVRVATWIKDHYEAEKFEATFEALVSGYWSKGINVSKTEGIIKALHGIFSEAELEEILRNAVSPSNKKRVIDQTLSTGAFGAPWIIAVNSAGERKNWFGNDRWDQVFAHLEVPYKPISIIPPNGSKL